MHENKATAIIGLGYWGKNVLRNLNDLGVLSTAFDSNPRIIKEWQESYPEVRFVSSLDDILRDKSIRSVAIASSAVSHFELARKCLEIGKDVFVEKPLALSLEEGEELIELAEKKGAILMVGHILQFHPAVKKLNELIAGGELGKIHYIYSNRLNIGKLRTEENILWSFAPHDISVILMLLQEEPVKVFAFGGDYLNRGVFDTTLTTLEFKKGIKAHIFVSWLHPYKEQKLIVVGSKVMIVFDDLTHEKLFLYPHKIEWKHGKIPVAQKADFQVIPVEEGEPLKLELKHFLECVKERKKPKTDGREGLRVLKILHAAEKELKKS